MVFFQKNVILKELHLENIMQINKYENAANETKFIIFRTRDITVGSIFVYVNYIKRGFFLADKSSVGCRMIQSTKHLVLLFKQEVQFSEQIPSIK